MGKAAKGKKEYQRVRADSGQHRRIWAVTLLLGIAAFVPVALRLYRLAAQAGDAEAKKGVERMEKAVMSADTLPPGKAAQEIVGNVNGYLRKKELEEAIKTAERELAGLKGLFTGKRRKELENEIFCLKNELSNLR